MMGNKICIDGWINDLQSKTLPHNVVEVSFNLKTKKVVGMKNSETPIYFKIPCFAKGNKAKAIKDNLSDGDRLLFWGRLDVNEFGKAYLVIDEAEFLNSFFDPCVK